MKKDLLLAALLVLAGPASLAFAGEEVWLLAKSELTYSAFHSLHDSFGTTRETRGKGVCGAEGCRFLMAVPVNTFDSGDANRDVHMVETVRGAQYPMIQVNALLPAEPTGPDFAMDVDVNFAGQKVHYAQLPFHRENAEGGAVRITGTIPLTLAAFKIKPPSLLTMKIKNDVPVKVDMTWQKQTAQPN